MRTVLVNGGSRGIGAEVVRLFAARGDRVAFTYLRAEEAALSLGAQTGALAIRADSACEGEVKAAVERVAAALGPVDVLVNSAAISNSGMTGSTSSVLHPANDIAMNNIGRAKSKCFKCFIAL